MTTKNARIAMFSVAVFALLGASFVYTDFAQADPQANKTEADYEYIKGKIQNDITEQEKIRDKEDQQPHKKEKAEKEIQRLNKNSKLADLKIKLMTDPSNAHKYNNKAMEIFDELETLYGPGQPSQEVPVDGVTRPVFHTNTNFDGSDRTRYHCTTSSNWDASVSGTVDTHFPVSSTWYANWNYPSGATNSGDPECETYDHEYNWIKAYGYYPTSCEHYADANDFQDSYWCPTIGYNTSVSIYGNAAYDEGGTTPVWWHPSHSFDVEYLE